jgi:acylphosphatase
VLPFQEDAAIAEFLRSADIVANEKIEIGITAPRHLTLEDNGVRVSAAFRYVDEPHSRVRLADGTYFQKLRDYCGFEVAAYQISLMLGMDNVPPAVHRRIGREDGTVQIWVEGTMMESERIEQELRAPNGLDWGRQIQEMLVLDELLGNIDRNPGNMLIDADWKVWLIDHTRAFQQGDKLKNAARIRMVRREFWEALKALDEDTVKAAVSNELDGKNINDMFTRRDLLVAHLQGLIDQRGEGAVIWE